ncbi:Velvet complex subunit B [Sparassis crispa]|uniref:Velvet complex subunit B n=1 Tax=Sparassis crispa TaxID=139825 RepID=A0A401GCR4_9APHY|nr:Velvet complex subunit B [Sparassis crispa]GBE79913.1 Velvet complex subunit B [Sparassis crispa]
MIQKTNARTGNTSTAPMRPPAGENSNPEPWGSWAQRKHYSLEVVQNPLRARMCGFGDKDRRPLAPAAVAKMIVRREDNGIIDVDDVDCSFFLVTVDLWSADSKHEMNLVLHPTSADRYVPANTTKPSKRRGTNSSTQRARKQSSPAPSATTPTTSEYPQSSTMAPYIQSTAPGYSGQVYPAYPPPPSENSFQPVSPYGPPPPDANPQPWGYPPSTSPVDRPAHYPPPIRTSGQLVSRNPPSSAGSAMGAEYGNAPVSAVSAGHTWQVENAGSATDDTEGTPYRTWPQDASYSSSSHNGVAHASGPIDPPVRASHPSPSSPAMRRNSYTSLAPAPTADTYSQGQYSQEPYSPMSQQGPPQQLDNVVYASTSYSQQPPPQQQQHRQQQPPPSAPQYQQGTYAQDGTPPSSMPPLPRHTYTRTLVGPLSANACRLLDEHRKPGIFFLFQDLSIRTEGTFRLRLRLMNVGAPPAPDVGAFRVHNDVSPVLAQTFTEPFIVYSAKRFPGVPDTTPLSIALGNQGQKLPLRNRNGSMKQGRKRQRSGSDGSGDESDET